jgi:hypothetical protein
LVGEKNSNKTGEGQIVLLPGETGIGSCTSDINSLANYNYPIRRFGKLTRDLRFLGRNDQRQTSWL